MYLGAKHAAGLWLSPLQQGRQARDRSLILRSVICKCHTTGFFTGSPLLFKGNSLSQKVEPCPAVFVFTKLVFLAKQ